MTNGSILEDALRVADRHVSSDHYTAEDALNDLTKLRSLLSAIPGAVEPSEDHSDDQAVDRFAAKMKSKLAEARLKGRGGWNDPSQCPVERLASMLVDHTRKGDPVDVGNFAMMLAERGVSGNGTVLSRAIDRPAPAAPVSIVKGLEWLDQDERGEVAGGLGICNYCIREADQTETFDLGRDEGWFVTDLPSPMHPEESSVPQMDEDELYPTLEAAKAACQADFARRISECITPTTRDEVEREANEQWQRKLYDHAAALEGTGWLEAANAVRDACRAIRSHKESAS